MDREWGFFAPEVATETRVSFDIVDKNGSYSTHLLSENNTREADLRIGDIESRLWETFQSKSDRLRNAITASWASQVFANHPQSKEVTVSFEMYPLKSMAAFRRGERSKWIPVYRATYTHSD